MNEEQRSVQPHRRSALISLVIFVAATALMVWLKLSLFPDRYTALSYALPLLICLWHKDRRLLWAMVATFAALSALKDFLILPGHKQTEPFEFLQWLMQVANIVVVAGTVHTILNLTDRLRSRNAELRQANEELTARGEEIARQNAELQAQSEELAQQNEELQQQGEELGRQNEELQQQAEELLVARYTLHAGDIVFARTGATTGKSFVIRSCPEAVFASYLIRVRASVIVLPEYLAHFFQSASYWNQISESVAGSAQPNCNASKLPAISVPLAPLPEQRRIVAKLEELLGRVERCREGLGKIPVLLKRFRQSVLAAACSGRLTEDWRGENGEGDGSDLVLQLEEAHVRAGGHKRGNAAPPTEEAHDLVAGELPSGWAVTELRSAVWPDRPITYGILKPGPNIPRGIPYVRVADFPKDKLDLETIRRTTPEIESRYARDRLREGDILLSIRGTVGRVRVVPSDLTGGNITQDTARLSVHPVLSSAFITWFLRAPATQKRMQRAIKGVAVRGINIGDVRALQVPVPPLTEQEEIVRRVDELFALADRIEGRFVKAREPVEKLAGSLLARAFSGKLVGQDPRDEPAGELLKRIRAGRAKGGG